MNELPSSVEYVHSFLRVRHYVQHLIGRDRLISWRTGLSVIQWIFNSVKNCAGRKLEGICKVM